MNLESLLTPALRLLAGGTGIVLIVTTLSAAVRSFVLPAASRYSSTTAFLPASG